MSRANVHAELSNFLSEDGVTVTLCGVLDEHAIPALKTVIFYYLDDDCRSFVFDFRDLAYLHVSGVGLIKDCSDILSGREGQAVVVNANRLVSNLFVYLKLNSMLYEPVQPRGAQRPSDDALTDASLTPYLVLGLEPGATQQEIHNAYRDMAHHWHAELYPVGSTQWTRAHKKMEEIDHAYLALTNLKAEPASD